MIADLPIQLATGGHARAIAELSRETIEDGLPWRWTPARVARAIRDPETNVAVIGDPQALVGFGIMSYPGEDAHLLLFAVRAASRRAGVGSALLRWLEAVARSAGARRIRLEARRDNAAARNFYGEHGYHERSIRKDMYGEAVDGIRLERWLRPKD